MGFETWVGFVAGVVPFMIGSYEFGKRIVSSVGSRLRVWVASSPKLMLHNSLDFNLKPAESTLYHTC